MLDSYIQGFFLGVGLAIPFGPINVIMIKLALKEYKASVTFGIGTVSSDIFYFSMILFGIISFLNNPLFLDCIGIFGSIFLFYFGFTIYKNRNKKLDTKESTLETKGLLKLYGQGVIFTLINPYTIIFWLSITGYTVKKGLDITFLFYGMMSFLLLWTTLMPYAVNKFKHKISQKVSIYLNLFSSIILFSFAISLLVEVVFF